MYCTYCGSNNHPTELCPKTWGGSAKRSNLYCTYCGSHTHDIKYCPKIWGGQMNRVKDKNGLYLD